MRGVSPAFAGIYKPRGTAARTRVYTKSQYFVIAKCSSVAPGIIRSGTTLLPAFGGLPLIKGKIFGRWGRYP